jgi:hypothetical protein
VKLAGLLFVSSVSLLSACSAGEGDSDSKSSAQASIFKVQREALEKAKGVELLLQEAADKQQLMIDEQTK